jgi:hypothetical protein
MPFNLLGSHNFSGPIFQPTHPKQCARTEKKRKETDTIRDLMAKLEAEPRVPSQQGHSTHFLKCL